jgi:BASS family bile acid:Na+ symporter
MNEPKEIVFNQAAEWGLYLTLGFIMFGVSLGITKNTLVAVIRKPKPLIIGLTSQWLLLPLLTWLLILVMKPSPEIACGMFLLAAVPGGNVSNYLTKLAGGNVSLSIALTFVSTCLSLFLTPLIFGFWTSLYSPMNELKQDFSLDPAEVMKSLLFLTVIPVGSGWLLTAFKPTWTQRISKPVNVLSGVFFFAFLAGAVIQNIPLFSAHLGKLFLYVLLMNSLAFVGAFIFAAAGGLKVTEAKTVSIETGIQNAGLALILVLQFFKHNAESAIICAIWGLWHIFSGLIWSWILRRFS